MNESVVQNIRAVKYRKVMYFYKCFIVIVLFGVVLSRNNFEIDATADRISYRLPNNTKPERYEITLVTNIDRNDFNFSGKVVIDIFVLNASSAITLHARRLRIKSINLIEKTTATKIETFPFTYNKTTEFLTVPTQSQLQKDSKYSLTVEYEGKLRSDLFGFYHSFYINSLGEKKQVELC